MAPMLDYTSSSPSSSAPSSPRSSHPTTFTVLPASPTDARRLVDIEFHAFENEQTNHILSYRDHNNPKHFSRALSAYTTTMQHKRRGAASKSSETKILKVVDVDSGDVVSFSKIEFKKYSGAELASREDGGHEGEAVMNRDWFALNERTRREYVGRRGHCYIAMLATQPQHQHRGAGTLLLRTVLAEADERGVEVYLEGTDTAKPLYEKHGFVEVKELRFDPADYGVQGYGVERQTVMVRGAMGRDGVRREVQV